jgi:hypothetical protein
MLKNPLIAAFFLFGLIGILIATRQVQLPQVFMPKANVLGVTLRVLPGNATLKVGQETSLDVDLNPADESVSAVELILNYDQSIIEVTDIKATEILPQKLALNLKNPGQASVILLVNPGSTKTAQGVIARVYVKAKKTGETSIKFDQSTKVSAIGKSGDVTGVNEGSQIIVTNSESFETVPTESPKAQSVDTSQADDLIKQYLNDDKNITESSESSGVVNMAAGYIQNIVKQINISVEKQARKWLD